VTVTFQPPSFISAARLHLARTLTPEDATRSATTQLSNLLGLVLKARWVEVVAGLWALGRKIARGYAEEGLYEVLEYDGTLELLDKRGERARIRKREKVRFVQSQTMAYQDQAWGDGEILLDYRCTPGVPVDRYRPAHKTFILISLREVKRRGDIEEFNIEWGMRGGFLRASELWETEVSHRTRSLKIQLVFPRSRPPLRVMLLEGGSQRSQVLPDTAQVRLPDGRWLVSWKSDRPRLHERYILKWDW